MSEPLDPTRPLFLNDGTPVRIISFDIYSVKVEISTLHRPHAARRQTGSNSHVVDAHRFSKVLTHNHAFTLTNEEPKMQFIKDQTVEYVGNFDPTMKGKRGTVVEQNRPDNVRVIFPSKAERGYLPQNLKVVANTRVRFGLASGTAASFATHEEASRKWHDRGISLEPTILQFTQECESQGAMWKTIKVDVLPVLPPIVEQLYYMDMRPMNAARPLATDSHVRVELHGGIVAKVEIVHPS